MGTAEQDIHATIRPFKEALRRNLQTNNKILTEVFRQTARLVATQPDHFKTALSRRLYKMTGNHDNFIRRAAAEALTAIGMEPINPDFQTKPCQDRATAVTDLLDSPMVSLRESWHKDVGVAWAKAVKTHAKTVDLSLLQGIRDSLSRNGSHEVRAALIDILPDIALTPHTAIRGKGRRFFWPVADILGDLLDDPDHEVRHKAFGALFKLASDKTISRSQDTKLFRIFIHALGNDDKTIRQKVLRQLKRNLPDETTGPELMRAIDAMGAHESDPTCINRALEIKHYLDKAGISAEPVQEATPKAPVLAFRRA